MSERWWRVRPGAGSAKSRASGGSGEPPAGETERSPRPCTAGVRCRRPPVPPPLLKSRDYFEYWCVKSTVACSAPRAGTVPGFGINAPAQISLKLSYRRSHARRSLNGAGSQGIKTLGSACSAESRAAQEPSFFLSGRCPPVPEKLLHTAARPLCRVRGLGTTLRGWFFCFRYLSGGSHPSHHKTRPSQQTKSKRIIGPVTVWLCGNCQLLFFFFREN